ncbi:aspartyl-phosphate phosphatase Spo0E family protein [Cytobacillus sp. FJAT-53684]|uniref:Aspartyl-phosphate phosphatase Spo0E family protein n=1 Tax=Cytobacillus mangrovibacter TaxID=3299024 RepID=A0ABW6K3M4_9BACI
MLCESELLKEIESCRKEMIDLAVHSSLSSKQVVETSKKLDRLLNSYQKLEKQLTPTPKNKKTRTS